MSTSDSSKRTLPPVEQFRGILKPTPILLKTIEQRQEAFRDLIQESIPLQKRIREIGFEQFNLSFEINLEIAQKAFPTTPVTEAEPNVPGEPLPSNLVYSPHDIPRRPQGAPPTRWCLAALVPVDDGRAAQTICDILSEWDVYPSEIQIQRTAMRVLLVR